MKSLINIFSINCINLYIKFKNLWITILITCVALSGPLFKSMVNHFTTSDALIINMQIIVFSPLILMLFGLVLFIASCCALLDEQSYIRKYTTIFVYTVTKTSIINVIGLIFVVSLIEAFILFTGIGFWYLVNHFHLLNLVQFTYLVLALVIFAFLDFLISLFFISVIDTINTSGWIRIKAQLPIVIDELRNAIAITIKFSWLRFMFNKFKFIAMLCAIALILSGYSDCYSISFNKFFDLIVLIHLMLVSLMMFTVSKISRNLHIEFKDSFDKFFDYLTKYILLLNLILMLFVLTDFVIVINSNYDIKNNFSTVFDTSLFFTVSLFTLSIPRMMKEIQKQKIKAIFKNK